MLPSVAGPGTVPPPPPPGLSARADQGAQPTTGETSAAATRALTANRVDPPRVLAAVVAFSDEAKRRAPPDPDGPAGPPPAFDATPLERERQRLLARVDLIAQPPEPKSADRPAPARTPEAVAAPDPVEARAASAPDIPDRPEPEASLPVSDPDAAVTAPEAEAVEAEPAVTAPVTAPASKPDAPAPVAARDKAQAAEADTRAIERLETEVAEVRRMSEPEPERSLDLVR